LTQAIHTPKFGAYIIGDEILSGKRQDAHLTQLIKTLKTRGLSLAWQNIWATIRHESQTH